MYSHLSRIERRFFGYLDEHEEKEQRTQCCHLAWSIRTLVKMGAFEPRLKELEMCIKTSRKLCNNVGCDCVGFRGHV